MAKVAILDVMRQSMVFGAEVVKLMKVEELGIRGVQHSSERAMDIDKTQSQHSTNQGDVIPGEGKGVCQV